MRENTYYPELCLVQLAGDDDVAVVDAQAKGIDLAPLGALLAKPDVVKVFHACRQDVEIFLLLFGAVPANLFDTQVAAMVAGFGDQVGYDALVSALTGGQIDKAHRFSDWSARPLTTAQVDYAAADVTHLRAVYEKLRPGCAWTAGWTGWREEMAALADPATYRVDPETPWERLKLRTNNRRQLAIVQAIAAWREREAQRVNIPRQRLVRDEPVPEIAALAPDDAEALSKARGITMGFAQGKSGQSLLAAIAAAKALPEDATAPRGARARHAAGQSPALVALLKVLLNAVASRTTSRHGWWRVRRMSSDWRWTRRAENPALQGWRREMFGEDALRLNPGRDRAGGGRAAGEVAGHLTRSAAPRNAGR